MLMASGILLLGIILLSIRTKFLKFPKVTTVATTPIAGD